MTFICLSARPLTDSGGWPMSIFLTPDQHPFYAGTYFPGDDRYGMPSFMTLLQGIAKAWHESRSDLIETGRKITASLGEQAPAAGMPEVDIFPLAINQFEEMFDKRYGGFGNAPKFPSPHNLFFFFEFWANFKDSDVLDMALITLRAMHSGGDIRPYRGRVLPVFHRPDLARTPL